MKISSRCNCEPEKTVHACAKKLDDAFKQAQDLSHMLVKKIIELRSNLITYLKTTPQGQIEFNATIIIIVSNSATLSIQRGYLAINKIDRLAIDSLPTSNGNSVFSYPLSTALFKPAGIGVMM